VDVELGVGVREVAFDGFHGEEQRLGNLAVALAPGCQLGDSALGGRQRLDPAGQERPELLTSRLELFVCSCGDRERPTAAAQLQGGPQGLACLGAAVKGGPVQRTSDPGPSND
jgi:hypothetical protein